MNYSETVEHIKSQTKYKVLENERFPTLLKDFQSRYERVDFDLDFNPVNNTTVVSSKKYDYSDKLLRITPDILELKLQEIYVAIGIYNDIQHYIQKFEEIGFKSFVKFDLNPYLEINSNFNEINSTINYFNIDYVLNNIKQIMQGTYDAILRNYHSFNMEDLLDHINKFHIMKEEKSLLESIPEKQEQKTEKKRFKL